MTTPRTRIAVLFIDALPYFTASSFGSAESFHFQPLVPSLGYSVNAKAEMFAGLTPDKFGVFNEYQYVDRPPSFGARLLAPIDRLPLIAWALRRVISRGLRIQLNNIPFAWRGNFVRAGANAYESDFVLPSIFNSNPIRMIRYSDLNVEDRDSIVADRLMSALEDSPDVVFAAFPDLDRTLHRHGFGAAFDARVTFYDGLIGAVTEKADSTIVCSDHGMCDVTASIDILDRLRQISAKSHMRWFLDSTILRLWNVSDAQRSAIGELATINSLKVLTLPERESYGVVSAQFGDLIAIAPLGSVFSPNFYGRSRSRGMHGYWPLDESQWGLIGVSGLLAPTARRKLLEPIGALQCHDFLQEQCSAPPAPENTSILADSNND
jgi:hypothetical protein